MTLHPTSWRGHLWEMPGPGGTRWKDKEAARRGGAGGRAVGPSTRPLAGSHTSGPQGESRQVGAQLPAPMGEEGAPCRRSLSAPCLGFPLDPGTSPTFLGLQTDGPSMGEVGCPGRNLQRVWSGGAAPGLWGPDAGSRRSQPGPVWVGAECWLQSMGPLGSRSWSPHSPISGGRGGPEW